MDILLTVDDNYLQPCLVLINSIFVNNQDNINIHIMHCGDMSDDNLNKISKFVSEFKRGKFYSYYVNIDWIHGKTKGWYPIIFLKLYAMKVLVNLDRVLYLDCDTLVVGNIKEFWEMDISNYYFCGVEFYFFLSKLGFEEMQKKRKGKHFNAGSILMNLKLLRENDCFAKWIDYFNKNYVWFVNPEEDIIDTLWYDKIKYVDFIWNYINIESVYKNLDNITRKPVIIHYIAKPWKLQKQMYTHFLDIYEEYSNIDECRQLHEIVKRNVLINNVESVHVLKEKIKNNFGLPNDFAKYLYQNKFLSYENVQRDWLFFKMDNGDIKKYFDDKGYKKIAVYGVGSMAELFYYDIKNRINISYFIDKYSNYKVYYNKKVIRPDKIQNYEKVDAIVVTPYLYFLEIEKDLKELELDTDIVSLYEIIYWCK